MSRISCLALAAIVGSAACGGSHPASDGKGAAPGTAPDGPDAPDAAASEASAIPPVVLPYAAPGPSAVSTCAVVGPSAPCAPTDAASDASAASSLYVVFYPTDMGGVGSMHAILTWGNGSDADPAQYSILLTHLASWGFVVVASTNPNTGTGREMLAGEDYLVAASTDMQSPFYGRLDVDHIGALGHSQGADGAAQALLAADAPGSAHRFITTLVPIELPAQHWTCIGSSDPSCPAAESFDAKSLVSGSVFFVDGSRDTLIAPPTQGAGASGEQSVQAYYDATPAPTPKAKGTLVGADHNDIQDHCMTGVGCAGVGPQGYLGYITAWLLYQLQGDAAARASFAGAAPTLDHDPAWQESAQANLP